MDLNRFSQEVRSNYQQLMGDSNQSQFELTYEISDDCVGKIEGGKKDSDRWGENNYALDATVEVTVEDEDVWGNVEDEVEKFVDTLQELLDDTIGYTGPIVIRSSDDPLTKAWARRLIKETPDDISEE